MYENYNFGNLRRHDICEMFAKETKLKGLIAKELSYPVLNGSFKENGMHFDYVMLELKPVGIKSAHKIFTSYPNAEMFLDKYYDGDERLSYIVFFCSDTKKVLDTMVGITVPESLQDEPQDATCYFTPCEQRKLNQLAIDFYERWKDSDYATDEEEALYDLNFRDAF